jgi:3-deoxy-D-manno-octulosonate 8-phosphate phosphatase (KDO 8-P phosphatase)
MPSRKKKKYLTKTALAKKLAGIRALILDVDGVLTDDRLYFGPDGFELKQFHIGDGLDMVLALRAGLEIIVVSNRPSEATASRMKDLGVRHVIQEHANKAELVCQYLEKQKIDIDLSECAFVGNDIMDIPMMQDVGVKICVNDAYPQLKAVVDYVTDKKGGHGAVREIIDLYFRGRRLFPGDFLHK